MTAPALDLALYRVHMPEGTYLIRHADQGGWEVRMPGSRRWQSGYESRFEISVAIADRSLPGMPITTS
jgi:hypothetical protein